MALTKGVSPMVTQPKSPLAEHGRGTVEKLPSVDIVQIGGQGQDGIMLVENAPGNLNMSEVGGKLSRVNYSCDTKVRDEIDKYKPQEKGGPLYYIIIIELMLNDGVSIALVWIQKVEQLDIKFLREKIF